MYSSLQWDNGGSLIGFGWVSLKGGIETTLCEEAFNVIEVVKFSCIFGVLIGFIGFGKRWSEIFYYK
jgi:hypothetical protein